MKFSSEIEMAKLLIAWLEEQRWEIYQEVQIVSFGSVADIIAVRHNVYWIIETKLTLSLDLIYQALEWRKTAHYISIAVPSAKHNRSRTVAEYFLKNEGIGLITIRPAIWQQIKPKLFRKARIDHIKNRLSEKHKTYAEAGNALNQYYTPYRETCCRILKFVEQNPGCILKELVESVDHHYASMTSARSAIAKWAALGKVPGIRCERDGKFLKFYPDEGNNADQG